MMTPDVKAFTLDELLAAMVRELHRVRDQYHASQTRGNDFGAWLDNTVEDWERFAAQQRRGATEEEGGGG